MATSNSCKHSERECEAKEELELKTLAGVLALREVLLKVQTSRFGEIEVDNADVITLPEGLVGFPELARYVLLDHDSDSSNGCSRLTMERWHLSSSAH